MVIGGSFIEAAGNERDADGTHPIYLSLCFLPYHACLEAVNLISNYLNS